MTAHHPWKEVLETLRAKFHTVNLPKSFTAVNLSEKIPQEFGQTPKAEDEEKAELLPAAAAMDGGGEEVEEEKVGRGLLAGLVKSTDGAVAQPEVEMQGLED